ncbi:MAG TPA: hypothetical protein VJT49_13970 [Amycolatopsis sp.]|uniref:hypothetical protein n=1 Tax=Amycolatopsis sp. TaxID=37632 RepID=UPI002B488206|nr:hypothetical protein [Amycolatopsis sp.]HKS46190.1 hypothetical protein [Amycolatopsis sp.]
MIESVAELPPIVADLFGVHPGTAYAWAQLAQTSWTDYLAACQPSDKEAVGCRTTVSCPARFAGPSRPAAIVAVDLGRKPRCGARSRMTSSDRGMWSAGRAPTLLPKNTDGLPTKIISRPSELGKHTVDLITAYSKRPDLADALARAVQQIERAQDRGVSADHSVRSTARSGQPRRVVDRLSAAEIRLLIDAFERGTPKWKLAEQYAISESSIKRLLRKHRAEQDSVTPGA